MALPNDFFSYQAQTSLKPLALEVQSAKGNYVYDVNGKSYLDFIAGVSACTLGHCHPKITAALTKQISRYLHVMVYGEFIQQPAVELCKLLAQHLPENLSQTYLVNSGTEATEGAIKLAKRVTARSQVIAAKRAYHGNTMGAMSVMGFEQRKQAFRPLVPGTHFITYNQNEDLLQITTKTACVILETIQGGAGVIVPENNYLKKVQARCKQVGALFILDEIQTGIGRTGTLFGFEHYNVIPDILISGKGLGGGMPIGAFTASKSLMQCLQKQPKLGHITTFGGNPVVAAAALATLQEVVHTNIMQTVAPKEQLFRTLLKHKCITEIRGKGLLLALILPSAEMANQLVLLAKEEGLLLFWLLFEPKAVRISPPLTISEEEIQKGCAIILNILASLEKTIV